MILTDAFSRHLIEIFCVKEFEVNQGLDTNMDDFTIFYTIDDHDIS